MLHNATTSVKQSSKNTDTFGAFSYAAKNWHSKSHLQNMQFFT